MEWAKSVIRTAQDHADRDDHPAVAWLETLVAQAERGAVARIASQLPEYTVRLRAIAVRAYEKLVEAQQAAATAGDTRALLSLPTFLVNLGFWQSQSGLTEAALETTREAVEQCRGISAARPDTFRPILAHALNNLLREDEPMHARQRRRRAHTHLTLVRSGEERPAVVEVEERHVLAALRRSHTPVNVHAADGVFCGPLVWFNRKRLAVMLGEQVRAFALDDIDWSYPVKAELG